MHISFHLRFVVTKAVAAACEQNSPCKLSVGENNNYDTGRNKKQNKPNKTNLKSVQLKSVPAAGGHF